MRIFATDNFIGALAHLARAFDWQSKGDEFESRMLHTKKQPYGCFFCVNSLCVFSAVCVAVHSSQQIIYTEIGDKYCCKCGNHVDVEKLWVAQPLHAAGVERCPVNHESD